MLSHHANRISANPERLNADRFLGAPFVLAGITLAAFQPRESLLSRELHFRLRRTLAIALLLFSAIGSACAEEREEFEFGVNPGNLRMFSYAAGGSAHRGVAWLQAEGGQLCA